MLINPDVDVRRSMYAADATIYALPRSKPTTFEISRQRSDKPPVQSDSFSIPYPLTPQYKAMLINFESCKLSSPYIEIEADNDFQSIHNKRIFKTDDGVSICICSPQSILPKGLKTRKFVISWIDLSSFCSKEIERLIESDLVSKYKTLAKWNTQKIERNKRIDISWNKSLKPLAYNYSTNGSKVFHYIGMGFPPPRNGEICIKVDEYSENLWISMHELRKNFQTDCLYIFDCDNAASLKQGLIDNIKEMEHSINGVPLVYAMFATSENQKLLIPETLPQNLFSCILIDPVTVINSLYPETKNKEKSTVSKLIDIYSESIALNSLDSNTFSQLFRRSNLASALWRNFMLAQRIMRNYGIFIKSIPELPDCSDDSLWLQLQYVLQCPQQEHIVTIYINHFRQVPTPQTLICSVLGIMMKVPEYYEKIIIEVSYFMRRSFKHISYIMQFLDIPFIGQHRITKPSLEGYRAWISIISATLLVDPASKKYVQEDIDGRFAISVIKDPETDDIVRAMMLSIFIVLSDAQTYYVGYLGDESLIASTVKTIFSERNSPQTRLWLAIFVRALVNHIRAEPKILSDLRVPFLCSLLLHERDALTRAIAVSILSSCAHKLAPNFNAYLLRLAIPTAFDCSPIVRRAFSAFALHFIHLNQIKIERKKEPLSAKLFIRNVQSLPDVPGKFLPELPSVLEHLSKDPSEGVSEIVSIALSAQKNDLKRSSEVIQSVYEETQRLAHISLFLDSEIQDLKSNKQRYSDDVLADGGLELLEVLHADDNEYVLTIAFDRGHSLVAFGTDKGRLICGNNKWELNHGSVTSVAFVDGGYIVAGCSDGVVYTIRPSDSSIRRCFAIGIGEPFGHTFISAAPGCNTIICNGSKEVISYDIAAGIPIAASTFPAAMTACARIGTDFVAASDNGVVTMFDKDLNEKWHINLSVQIKEIGQYTDSLFASSEEICFIVNTDGQIVRSIDRCGVLVLHPSLQCGIEYLRGNEPKLVNLKSDEIKPLGSINTSVCIFDADRPIAAIGGNGGVQLWRLPTSIQ